MRTLAWLLLALPLAAETVGDRVKTYMERGWHEERILRAAEVDDLEEFAATLAEEFGEALLPAPDRIDLALMLARAQDNLGRFRIVDAGRRRAAAWLPRGGAGVEDEEGFRKRLKRLARDAGRVPSRLTAMTREDVRDSRRDVAHKEKELADFEKLLKDAAPAELAEAKAALGNLDGWLKEREKDAPEMRAEEAKARKYALYVHRMRWQVGVDLEPADILALGQAEFARTLVLLEATAKKIDGKKTWREIAEELKEDHPAADDLLDECRKAMDAAAAFARKKNFVTIPDWASNVDVKWGDPRSGTPYGHYQPCRTDDPKLQGFYIVTPVSSLKGEDRENVLRDNNRAWIRVVALHEAIPGHHLQFAIAARRTRDLPKWFYNPAYVEGWGLYCEELFHRHGYYDDRTRLSQLRMKLWRCARAIIDVGAHFGGMTREEAVRLLVERVGMARKAAEMEVDRYLASPGYYSGYLLGLTRIEALREKVGGGERRFHDALLGHGALPFDILEEEMLGERR